MGKVSRIKAGIKASVGRDTRIEENVKSNTNNSKAIEDASKNERAEVLNEGSVRNVDLPSTFFNSSTTIPAKRKSSLEEQHPDESPKTKAKTQTTDSSVPRVTTLVDLDTEALSTASHVHANKAQPIAQQSPQTQPATEPETEAEAEAGNSATPEAQAEDQRFMLKPQGIEMETGGQKWTLVCCDRAEESQFSFQCDTCGGWEHGLCTIYAVRGKGPGTSHQNRIENGGHTCKNCSTQKIKEQHELWSTAMFGEVDPYEDVIVCKCGHTDREVVADKDVVPEIVRTAAEEAAKREADMKLKTEMQKKNPYYRLLPDADDYRGQLRCNWCGSLVHQKCFGFDGNQDMNHLWLICVRCEDKATLRPGETYGGLQCDCGDNDEKDLTKARVTCGACKLELHLECEEDDVTGSLAPGDVITCSVCRSHLANEWPWPGDLEKLRAGDDEDSDEESDEDLDEASHEEDGVDRDEASDDEPDVEATKISACDSVLGEKLEVEFEDDLDANSEAGLEKGSEYDFEDNSDSDEID